MTKGDKHSFSVPLPSGQIADVRIPFPMPLAEYNVLIETLRLWKPSLVGEAERDKKKAETAGQ
jgi:hypothetical protein